MVGEARILFMILSLVAITTVTLTAADSTNTPNKKNRVLHVGDSYASNLGQTFETFCKGSEVVNAGVGGSNALQWSTFTQKQVLVNGCGDNKNFDEVYISVGGNDFNGSGCTLTHEELSTRVADAIRNIAYNIAPGAKTYVLLGYCIPPKPFESDNVAPEDNFCDEPGASHPLDLTKLNLDVEMPEGSKLDLYDNAYVCGGTEDTPGKKKYFKSDEKHLNVNGYCKYFMEDPAIQESFGCEEQPPMNCNNLDFELYGTEQVCERMGDDIPWKYVLGFSFAGIALGLCCLRRRRNRKRAAAEAAEASRAHENLEMMSDAHIS